MAIDAETAREQRKSATKPAPKVATPTPTPKPKPSGGLSAADKKSISKSLGGISGSISDLLKKIQASGLGSVAGSAGGAFAGYASDAEYAGSNLTGTSNTGKRYIKGVLVSEEEFSIFLRGDENKRGGGTTETTTSSTEETDKRRREGQSAYALLLEEFNRYGLGGLVEPLKGFIVDGLSPAEFTLRLRDTKAYQNRFAANRQRINKGLRALSEAEYIELEDQYQNVMRNYGLPASYYARGDMGRQEGFEKFIGGDVSAAELEDRIQTAQNRVINAAPEIVTTLKSFYPDITNGDILTYALDPDKAITEIRRKVTAAEIGAGAMQAGLTTGLARAEELQRYGVTKETAQQGFGTIASGLERGRQLSQIYKQPNYTQAVAEAEVFALPDAEKARRQRRKLGQLEAATFRKSSGIAGGALDRERAGQY